jgi:DNA sulfur modification protein DndB
MGNSTPMIKVAMPIRLTLPKPKKEWRYIVPEGEVGKYTAKGFSVAPHKRYGKHVVTKRKPEWEKFEDEVLILFRYGLKLSEVDGGAAFHLAGYQIDAVGGIEDTLLVVECKSKQELGTKSLRSALKTFWVKRREIAASLRRKYHGQFRQTKFVLALRGITPSNKDSAYAKKKKIIIWSESYFDSIRSLYFTIGERAKYYVLRELGGKPPLVPGGKGRYFTFPALAAPVGDDRIFSLLIPASILLDIAYVLRIESGQKRAYQRFLDKNRLFKIAKFLEDGKSFKNSIVLALDNRAKFSAKRIRWGDVPSYGSQIGLLKIPRQYASAWVIDGQHRLYGFARAKDDLNQSLLSVVAVNTRSRIEEAETFIDINKNQKPVDPNLLWALFGQLYRNETSGVISDLVRRLGTERRSILYNKIYVPGDSKHPRREYRIFHSNLCETIGDHLVAGRPKGFPLISDDNLSGPKRSKVLKHAIDLIDSYLSFISDLAEKAQAKDWIPDFFFTNNGLNVMIRVLVQILRYTDGKFDSKKIDEQFGLPLSEYLASHEVDIDDFRRQTSSEGTRDVVAYGFIGFLAAHVKDFAVSYLREHQRGRENQEPYKLIRQIEESLRKCISDSLSAISSNWWKERIFPDVKESAQERKQKDESPWPWMEGKHLPTYFYMDFSEYSRIITRRDNWREAFRAIFSDEEWVRVWFKEIERIRIEVAHNRDLSERELTLLKVFSEDFARVLSGSKSKLEIPDSREVGVPLAVEA